jgi:hypothetical protein
MAEAAPVLVLSLSSIAPPQQMLNRSSTLGSFLALATASCLPILCPMYVSNVQCQDIFLVLRRELERRDLLIKAKVHISPSCPL